MDLRSFPFFVLIRVYAARVKPEHLLPGSSSELRLGHFASNKLRVVGSTSCSGQLVCVDAAMLVQHVPVRTSYCNVQHIIRNDIRPTATCTDLRHEPVRIMMRPTYLHCNVQQNGPAPERHA